MDEVSELRSKIAEALISALPITLIVYLISLLPWFNFSGAELIVFTIGAVLLILGIAFSLPVSDVAGLAPTAVETKE